MIVPVDKRCSSPSSLSLSACNWLYDSDVRFVMESFVWVGSFQWISWRDLRTDQSESVRPVLESPTHWTENCLSRTRPIINNDFGNRCRNYRNYSIWSEPMIKLIGRRGNCLSRYKKSELSLDGYDKIKRKNWVVFVITRYTTNQFINKINKTKFYFIIIYLSVLSCTAWWRKTTHLDFLTVFIIIFLIK